MKEAFLKILEEMPVGLSSRLKIGENDYALKKLKKTNHKNITMEDIRLYNSKAEGWSEGYAAAVQRLTKWRNEKYLELKNLNFKN